MATLICVYLNLPEHEGIVADPHFFPAGGGYIPENDLPAYYIGKFLSVGIVGHL